jgi:dienelactone hydrolase
MPRFIRCATALLMQLLLAFTPARATASGSVASMGDLQIKDSKLGKTLQVRVTYPGGSGPLPLIVFSHGAGASKDDYQPLVRHWAAKGYIVLQVNHEDSGAADRQERYQAWSSRPGDISALLDHLDDIESQVPELRGRIDRKHIGAAGHSFGGQTAQMIGGFRFADADSYRDERVSAVVLLAPPGGGPSDTPGSWRDMHLPMLTVIGGADTGRSGESPMWRSDAYRNAPSRDDYLIVIDQAEHLLGGISETRSGQPVPQAPDQVALVYAATTLFWDSYLKDNGAACNALGSGEVVAQSPASARFESKSGVRLRSASAPEQVQFATPAEAFMRGHDVNGDGVLSRDETPARLPDRAFDQLDSDGDGVLSASEVQVLTERLNARSNGGRAGRRGQRREAGTSAAPAAPEMAPFTETKSSGKAVCHRD